MHNCRDTRLSDLIEIKHGFAFRGEFFVDELSDDILVTPGNFAIGGGFQLNRPKYYNGPVPEEYVLSAGDVIVTMTDLSKDADTLGYSAIVPASKKRFLHNQRIGKVIPKDNNVYPPYIAWVMRTRPYRSEIVGGATGSTVKHTSPSRILSYRLKLPPPSVQRAIAAVLGALDDKIELNRRMNETLEAMARAIFKDWFVDFGPTRAKMEGREAYLAPEIWTLFPSRTEEGGIPNGWRHSQLLKHARLISGGTPKTEVAAFWNGSIPWASAKDVSQCNQTFLASTERSITGEGLSNSSTKLVPAYSTVIVARGATTGRHCLFGQEMAMNQTCYALTSDDGLPIWLYLQLGSIVKNIVQAAHGSVFDTITTSTLADVLVLIPDSNLCVEFEKSARPLFDKILANQSESRTLAATRDLLLPKLMSGEIRVKDAEAIASQAL